MISGRVEAGLRGATPGGRGLETGLGPELNGWIDGVSPRLTSFKWGLVSRGRRAVAGIFAKTRQKLDLSCARILGIDTTGGTGEEGV